MKIQLTLLAILLYSSISAQTIHFKIDGVLENTTNAKFAYLSTLSQQLPISSDKVFIKVPVVNGKFEFNGTFDLEGRSMQHACVFFDDRSTITKDELALKFKNLIWVTGRETHLLRIVLEDLSLKIKSRDENTVAKVVKNGVYTKEYYEYLIAGRKGRKELVEFLLHHSTSPVSFEALQRISFKENEVDSNESLSSLFYKLSSKLRASKDGQALKKSLNIN